MSKINAATKLCLIIGDPVEKSRSPAMHNAAYAGLGIDGEFVFAAAKVEISKLESALKGIRALNVRGISCTMPHKIAVMPYLDEIDEMAKKIGAVNTIVNEAGRLKGYNTDWLGVVTPLEAITRLGNKRVALIGAGGAARACVAGLQSRGAHVTIFNRTVSHAQKLAGEFGCDAHALERLNRLEDYDIVLNASSLGMTGVDPLPIPTGLRKDQVVFDIVYTPRETALLKAARSAGSLCIEGLEMLLHQGIAQFELYTGRTAPVEVMRAALFGSEKEAQ